MARPPTIRGGSSVAKDVLSEGCSEDARSLLAAIVDSSDDAILSKNLEGIVLSWNRAAERLYGYTAEEVIGKPIGIIVPDSRAFEVADFLARLARGERVEHVETERIRKDGTIVPVSLTISPVRDADGNVVGASAIARDITERRRAELALREAMRAEAANRAKSEFLSRMNHELRTPLNAILGFAQILEMDDAGLTNEHKEAVTEIMRAGRHLLGLIGDVLDISKAESGRLALCIEEVDVCEVVEESLSLVKGAASERQIDIQVGDISEATVTADRQALKQMTVNLLSNAVKYNRDRGVIRIDAAEKGDRLKISVQDTGVGIPRDKLARLFTPFDRLGAETTSVQGTGLGLTLVRHLATAMGGDLTVESSPDVGSVFAIELPSRPNDNGEARVGSKAIRF
jgi:PAS domain S-box-containing protein